MRVKIFLRFRVSVLSSEAEVCERFRSLIAEARRLKECDVWRESIRLDNEVDFIVAGVGENKGAFL